MLSSFPPPPAATRRLRYFSGCEGEKSSRRFCDEFFFPLGRRAAELQMREDRERGRSIYGSLRLGSRWKNFAGWICRGCFLLRVCACVCFFPVGVQGKRGGDWGRTLLGA